MTTAQMNDALDTMTETPKQTWATIVETTVANETKTTMTTNTTTTTTTAISATMTTKALIRTSRR